MTILADLRWRAIVLVYTYAITCVLGVSVRSIERWHGLVKSKWNVLPEDGKDESARYPKDAIDFVEDYIRAHPCFYLEDLQEAV
ncbi:hypothetical protein PHMEG_00030102 [Phytophthora megakarya]|uniref:Uncharacterized protein n=1 Tax=Phytophthora megakarya TaxID=4795 RepID=A0A225UZM6_9STRA|nr:hypothetical protein PHMEG_00030102 [Phytophthora megakarya]